jgi:hypothetical protein
MGSRGSQAERLIKPTGRIYRQDYVLLLRSAGGKIAALRECFDPVHPAKALDTPIFDLGSRRENQLTRYLNYRLPIAGLLRNSHKRIGERCATNPYMP